MTGPLDGRTALVLGGSRGLGLGVASALHDAGARLAITSRTLAGAQAAATQLGDATAFACDTGERDAVDRLIAGVEAWGYPLDILVLNGGGPPAGPALGIPAETWTAQFEAMFVNLVRIADAIVPGMRSRGFGRVLIVASSGVVQPIPNLAISNALRAALVGWSKTLAGEVGRDGVTVNVLAPGRIATDRVRQLDDNAAVRSGSTSEAVRQASEQRIPVGRYGTTAEFGAMAAFLASPQASYITGSIHRIDGGMIAATS